MSTVAQPPLPRSVKARRKITPAPNPEWADLGDGLVVERGVHMTLRDGTRLVSDHYYPPEHGRGIRSPTLLVRQPYGRAIATTVVYAQPAWFARHGYNVVVQDVRGRGDSEGEFYPFAYEGRDGFETVEWVAQRPECNGRVGMYGFSYQGLTQLLAAAERPPALQCISPAQTAGDLYEGWFYHHGALRLSGTVGWATQLLRADARRLADRGPSAALEEAAHRLPALVGQSPYGKIPELTHRRLPPYFREWVGHRQAGAYWSSQDVSLQFRRISVPALHVIGWYDSYLHGSALLYDAMTSHEADPVHRHNQFLVAGPWQHIPWGRTVGDLDFGPEANFDTDGLLLRWFNHWLKDSGEMDHEPRVRLFVMGENQWKHRPSWNAYGTMNRESSTWHLHSLGRANSSRGDGLLTMECALEEPRDGWVDEPEVPVVYPGPPGTVIPMNQAKAEQLNNLLVYSSPPLTEALTISGAPRVVLYSTSSCPSADLVAKLVRVLPDGKAYPFSVGIARSSWLFGPGNHRPNQIHRWEFSLEPTCCRIEAGQQLRLDISGSAFPLYDRNPGSDVPPHLATPLDWRQNLRQLLHTSTHPSHIVLPLLS